MKITRRRILLALGLLLLSAVCVTGWYITTKGFFRPWRNFVSAEFEKHGLEVSLQRLTLDPFRGLVARDVKLYDARNRRRVLASIDEMVLGVNYAEAARGGNALDWVDLHEARVTLPLDPGDPDGTQIDATRLNARFFLPPQQIYLARAEAEILGVRVFASGRLLNPQSFPGRRPGTPEGRERALSVFNLLASLRYQEKEPVLSFEFSGDLAVPGEIMVSARLAAPSVRRKSYTLTEVNANATWRAGQLEVQRLSARDGHGELRGAASYDAHASRVSARVESSLGVTEFARAYGLSKYLEPFTLHAAPQLDLTITGSPARPEEWRVFGHLALERFTWDTVPFRGVTADVSWMAGRWSVRDLHLRHSSGKVEGDLICLPEGFRASLRGTVNPRELSPLFAGALAEWVNRFDFIDVPSLSLEVRGAAPSMEACAAEGEVAFGRSTYDGAAAPNGKVLLRFGENVLRLAPFRRTEGDAEGAQLVFDLRRRQVKMEPITPAPEIPAHGHS